MRRVGSYLLNFVYMGVLALVSPLFLWNSLTKGKYREGFREKFWGEVPERAGNRDCIWLHAVSVGEVNLLATTLRELTSRRPDIEIVISTTTKTGYELARRKYGEQHSVFYCPLDFSWATRRAMQRVRPSLLVLAELELWPNLIIAAKEQGARVAIINGRLSDNSFRGYRRAKWLVGRVLGMADLVAAQDATTAGRFRKLRTSKLDAGDQAVIVTGSLKYDGAETHRSNARTRSLQTLAGIAKDDIVWLVGSTQSPEEEMAVRLYAELRQRHPELRLVIVPRHPERFDEVARQLDGSGLPWHRRSQLEASLPVPQSIILVDTVGELGAWWGTASIGFVGGSFGDRGGQNMIEPAAYGVATCFGPNTWNFRDIVAALLSANAAEVVHDEAALEEFVARCLDEPEFSRSLGERARQFVASQLGATKRTVDLLERLLPEVRAKSNAAA